MAILIYSEQENAHVALSPAIINGVYQQHRSYRADGHNLMVDGSDDFLVSEDAEQILATPGFRLATASEQEEAYTASKRKASSLKESKESK
jgi:hypothetical protein